MRGLMLLTFALLAFWLVLDEFYGKKKVISTMTALITGEITPDAAMNYTKSLQKDETVSDVFKAADTNAFDARV
jgi:hypothetical protein